MVFACGIAGTLVALRSRSEAADAFGHVVPATIGASALYGSMLGAQSATRGYFLTHVAAYLDTFTDATRAVRVEERGLARELTGRPRADALLRVAQSRFDDWLRDYADPQIRAVQRGTEREGVVVATAPEGRRRFALVRSGVRRLRSSLELAEADSARQIRELEVVTLVLLATVALCAVLGALLGYLFARRYVIKPVRHIQREVDLVAGGAFDHVVHGEGSSEVESLGTSVERMRSRLLAVTGELSASQGASRMLQESLLAPSEAATPQWLSFAVRYRAGTGGAFVGGDWYNVVCSQNRWFCAVGDVAGHGLEAAIAMAGLRYAVDAYATEDPDPRRVVSRVSKLAALSKRIAFATLMCALVDRDTHELSLASAGHPPPILVRPDGTAEVLDVVGDPPLGVGHRAYRLHRLPLASGVVLVAFTDGLIERRDRPLTDGYAALLAAASEFAATPGRDPGLLLEHLVRSMVPEDPPDDVLLAAFQLAGVDLE